MEYSQINPQVVFSFNKVEGLDMSMSQAGHNKVNSWNLLVVGNNPTELGAILEKIQNIKDFSVATEIAFDIRSTIERLLKFKPNFVLIDDNIGREEMRLTLDHLGKDKETRDIPVAVVKNSNYREAFPSFSIFDYLLKHQLSADMLSRTMRNAFRFTRTRKYLARAYKHRKNQLFRILR